MPSATILLAVLAAGASRRLGQPKQLVRWKGLPLVTHAVMRGEALAAARPQVKLPVVVVSARENAAVAAALAGTRASLLPNPEAAHGMATSIRVAVAAAREAGVDALLLTLADQPLVTAQDLARLVDTWAIRPDRPAATVHGTVPGVPAVFPKDDFPELEALEGDTGARHVLRQRSERAAEHAVSVVIIPGAAMDVDTPQDLAALHRLDRTT